MNHHTELLPDPLPAEPLVVVDGWLAESWKLQQQPNPNAMVVATVDPDGRPSARVVLCKKIVPQPGYLVFFTNYLSRKGRELTQNPRAAAVMHWDALHRQVRVEGPVVKTPEADSDAYFASRAWQSRLGAWASQQSEPIGSRKELQVAVAEAAKRFGTPPPDDATADGSTAGATTEDGTTEDGTTEDATAGETTAGKAATAGAATGGAAAGRAVTGGTKGDYAKGERAQEGQTIVIPRPPNWGGFRLWAESVELWVEGDARIHDRARWTRSLTMRSDGSVDAGPWTATRLQP
jgi:pyridoxamine 5'-phosphate oxidase